DHEKIPLAAFPKIPILIPRRDYVPDESRPGRLVMGGALEKTGESLKRPDEGVERHGPAATASLLDGIVRCKQTGQELANHVGSYLLIDELHKGDEVRIPRQGVQRTCIGHETVADRDEIVRVYIQESPGLELVRVHPVVQSLEMVGVSTDARPKSFQKSHPTPRLRSLHHDREGGLPTEVEWIELLSQSNEGVVRRDQL